MYIISLKNVSKIYRTSVKEVYALKNVSLNVSKREFLCITGPSGAGKTTLLNIISGITYPTSGEVYVLNTPLHNLDEDKLTRFRALNIGFIFQDYNLISFLTALENVVFARSIADFRDEEENLRRALELLELVGLSDRKDHLPSQLSGGERQRVAIARALANDPPIILADEPTGNLDEENAEIIAELLFKLNRKGKTVIAVSHDPKILEKASRIVVLKYGELYESH